MYPLAIYHPKEPWNKNKLVGQKQPLKLQQIWTIRIRLELFNKVRGLALILTRYLSKSEAVEAMKFFDGPTTMKNAKAMGNEQDFPLIKPVGTPT
ncbi:MAG: hypothetical protein ACI9C4_001798 [Paraglaciecola sp.]|jgi:hypothetical protein